MILGLLEPTSLREIAEGKTKIYLLFCLRILGDILFHIRQAFFAFLGSSWLPSLLLFYLHHVAIVLFTVVFHPLSYSLSPSPRYPWPLINREYVYVRRRFQDGDRFYYVMQAVNGREVLPDEEPDDDYKPRRLCTSVCAPCKSKQRVEDFVCLICFSPTKCRGASSSAAEWRQFGREHFGIHNAVVARAAKLAAAKSLWPFQTRVEQAFRSYTLKTNQAPKSTSSSSSSSSAPASEPSSPEQQRRGPLRPIANIFGWLTAPIRGGGKAKSKEDGD
mmetsp:Transcript_43611/g.70155  ORF Transcript_43611/g.70155 Transcript_43611/m.70155 type:complete len:275 (+) Transcript_43611:93-917(+)